MKIILTSINNKKNAEQLSRLIIKNKLAICIKIIDKISSIYYWNKKTIKDNEVLLIIKTISKNEIKLKNFLIQNHHYDVPEIISINAKSLNKKYTEWMIDFLNV